MSSAQCLPLGNGVEEYVGPTIVRVMDAPHLRIGDEQIHLSPVRHIEKQIEVISPSFM